MKKILLVAVFIQLYSAVSAQTFTIYKQNTSDWSLNDLNAITYDESRNVLWIGTRSPNTSLVKFDGVNWTNYTDTVYNCLGGEATDVFVDKDNNVWYSTWFNGIARYNGTSFTNYTSSNSGLTLNVVHALAADTNNTLYVGLGNGFDMQTLTGNTWANVAVTHTRKICVDKSTNSVWVGTVTGNLYKINNGIVTSYSPGSGEVLGLVTDNNGNIWLALDNATSGLVKFDGTTWTNYTSSNSGLINNSIGAIGLDKEGNVWIGGYYYSENNHRYLTKFDGNSWISYNIDSILSSQGSYGHVKNFASSNDNTFWVATSDGLLKMGAPSNIAENNTASNTVSLNPNPVKNNLNVRFLDNIDQATVSIVDIAGRVVATLPVKQTNNITVNTEHLAGGVYTLIVTTENKHAARYKFLKN